MWSLEVAQARIPPWPQVPSLATHITLFITILKSASLYYVHIFLSFSFSHFSTNYLFLLVLPRVSECLVLSQEWSQEC